MGEWGSISEGRIFKIWEQINEFPDIDGFWYGLDFGYSNDPTAIVKVVKLRDRIYLDEIAYQTGLTNPEIANLLVDSGYDGEVIICDSAEPKSIDELKISGINAIGADKGKGSILEGISFLKQCKVLVTAKSSNIIKENNFYQWKQDKSGNYINQPKDFMNHIIDAIRYAFSLNRERADKEDTLTLTY